MRCSHIGSLQLKSTEGAPGESGGNAVLCTSDKTFSIRQKNSSNTVYILSAKESVADEGDYLPETRSEAISEPQSTLETTPVAQSTAAAHITQLLAKLTTAGLVKGSSNCFDKSQLFANLPFSDAECEAAYRELAMFEDSEDGHCVLPSAPLKLIVWRRILENAQAGGIDLTGPLLPSQVLDLREGTEDQPPGLLKAVLHAVSDPSHDHRDIHQARLLRWTGINVVEQSASKTPIIVSIFRATWKELLPEQWREKIDVSVISDRATISDGGKKVMWKDYALDLTPGGADGLETGDGKATLGKRKWHEKFKPVKKGG